jgi:hypothetical protein
MSNLQSRTTISIVPEPDHTGGVRFHVEINNRGRSQKLFWRNMLRGRDKSTDMGQDYQFLVDDERSRQHYKLAVFEYENDALRACALNLISDLGHSDIEYSQNRKGHSTV